MRYLLDGFHQFFLSFLNFNSLFLKLLPDLLHIPLFPPFPFIINYLSNRVEMIILKHVSCEVLDLLIAEWASVVPVDRFFNTLLAVYMAASRYVTVFDLVQTDGAGKL